MRFSVCLPMFFRSLPLPEAVWRVAALGYDACEAWNLPASLNDAELAHACRENHVEFRAFCPDHNAMTAREDQEPYLESLKRACERANRLGAGLLITTAGNDTGKPRAEQHENVVRCLRAGAEIAQSAGVTLVLEPLNVLVDHKGHFLSASAEGFEILREVNSPNVRLLFDIYHQQITEGNVIANLTANLPLIGHLHAAAVPGRHELHTGELCYKRIFAAVDEAGWQGTCALEYAPLLPPEESLRQTKERFQ